MLPAGCSVSEYIDMLDVMDMVAEWKGASLEGARQV
jgi:hypothetical protein